MTEPCACVYVDDYDDADFQDHQMRTARKEHRCCECGRAITRGEKYEHATAKWDGPIRRFRTCQDCLSVRQSFFCHGWLYEGIWEMLGNHIHEVVMFGDGIASSCITALTPAARDKVCDMIEEVWGQMDDEEGER